MSVRPQSVRLSALWAAYGDGLGFVTEMVDRSGVRRRTGGDMVSHSVGWSRRIGGKYGITVDLPPGCYSDDTQLRLATGRAIRSDGSFDAEAFAKIELPVWRAYALGGGRGTKAAAQNLTKRDVNWFTNFFSAGDLDYLSGGGNGAAMRIQPHVWTTATPRASDEMMRDVVKNAICTHGHPRGLLGAVFHAQVLAETLDTYAVPGPERWARYADAFVDVATLIHEDSDLGHLWAPIWESRAQRSLSSAFASVRDEVLKDIEAIEGIHAKSDYEELVKALGLRELRERGSGTKTSLAAAAAAAWLGDPASPEEMLRQIINALGSDTDTIATMAGAICGAVAESEPRDDILDREYISREADRLAALSTGCAADTFVYPDLLAWRPPRHQVDALVEVEGKPAVLGLGYGKIEGAAYSSRRDDEFCWFVTGFGQSLLVKRRPDPWRGDREALGSYQPPPPKSKDLAGSGGQAQLFGKKADNSGESIDKRGLKTLDELSREAIGSGFDPHVIGKHILGLAEGPDGVERVIGYAAIIAKARLARLQRGHNGRR